MVVLKNICRSTVKLFISLIQTSPILALVVAISYYVPLTPVGLVAAGKTVYAGHSLLLWISFPFLMMWGVSGFDSGPKEKCLKWTIRNPWVCWMLLQLAYLICAAPLAILLNQGHPIQPPPFFDRSLDVMPYWLHGTPLLVGVLSGIVYMLLQYPIFRRFSDIDGRHLVWLIPVNSILMQLIFTQIRYNPFYPWFLAMIEANVLMSGLGHWITLRRIGRDDWEPSVTPGD